MFANCLQKTKIAHLATFVIIDYQVPPSELTTTCEAGGLKE